MSNKKALVAFFSHTGENYFPDGMRYIDKGNTHIAAEILAEIVDADLFEIRSVEKYSDVYKECVAKAVAEFKSNARPALAEDIDVSDYEVIYLGYPNWCGSMPMPVWTFLEGHDFGGKVILPFCTNEGSGLANSVGHIEKLVGGAEIKPGLSIKGSKVQESKVDFENWLTTIK